MRSVGPSFAQPTQPSFAVSPGKSFLSGFGSVFSPGTAETSSAELQTSLASDFAPLRSTEFLVNMERTTSKLAALLHTARLLRERELSLARADFTESDEARKELIAKARHDIAFQQQLARADLSDGHWHGPRPWDPPAQPAAPESPRSPRVQLAEDVELPSPSPPPANQVRLPMPPPPTQLPGPSPDAPGWTLVLDEVRNLRGKLLELHSMAPQLSELNHDGGRTYLAMARALLDQLRSNLLAMHAEGIVTFVQDPGVGIRAVPNGPVVWLHHLAAYLALLLQNHILREWLQPAADSVMASLPVSRLGFPRVAPETRTWYDVGVHPGVLPQRLQTLLDLWQTHEVDDDKAVEMEENLLRAFVYN